MKRRGTVSEGKTERGYVWREGIYKENQGRQRKPERYTERKRQRQRSLKVKKKRKNETFLFPFHQAVKLFLFLAHFPDCETLSIGQPYEVTI